MEPIWLRLLYPLALCVAGLASVFGVGTLIHGCATWYSSQAVPWEVMDAGFSALAAGCASGIASALIAITRLR